MEINSNNVINTSVNDVSTLTSAVNLESLNSTSRVDGNKDGSFAVDTSVVGKRSELSNSLKEFTKELSSGQSTLIKLESKSTILNNISNIVKDITVSEQPVAKAEEVQPTVKKHMEQYNAISTDISKSMEKYQEETDSTTYFDGRLGAKPLSPSQIADAVERQMAMVNQQKEFLSSELQKVETKALDTIGKEIARTTAEAPFEPIDFGKNISNFSSANINTVVGSVAVSQANAIPANSPKLLA